MVTQGIRGALETFGEWLAAAGFEHLSVEKRSHFFRFEARKRASTGSESSGRRGIGSCFPAVSIADSSAPREGDPRQCDS